MSTPQISRNPATSFSHSSPTEDPSPGEARDPGAGILALGAAAFASRLWPVVFFGAFVLALAEELDRVARRRAEILRESLLFERQRAGRLTDRVLRAEQRVAELTEELARERDQALRDGALTQRPGAVAYERLRAAAAAHVAALGTRKAGDALADLKQALAALNRLETSGLSADPKSTASVDVDQAGSHPEASDEEDETLVYDADQAAGGAA